MLRNQDALPLSPELSCQIRRYNSGPRDVSTLITKFRTLPAGYSCEKREKHLFVQTERMSIDNDVELSFDRDVFKFLLE